MGRRNEHAQQGGWPVAARWGAVLAVVFLALFSAFGGEGKAGDMNFRIFPLVLVCIAGGTGGVIYHILKEKEPSRWWHRTAGILIYLFLVWLAFFLSMNSNS